jgi:hypothetical protein
MQLELTAQHAPAAVYQQQQQQQQGYVKLVRHGGQAAALHHHPVRAQRLRGAAPALLRLGSWPMLATSRRGSQHTPVRLLHAHTLKCVCSRRQLFSVQPAAVWRDTWR